MSVSRNTDDSLHHLLGLSLLFLGVADRHCRRTCAKFNCLPAAGALFAPIRPHWPRSTSGTTSCRPENAKHKKGGTLKGWTAPSLADWLACVIFALGLASSIQKTWWNLTDDFLYLNTFEINRRRRRRRASAAPMSVLYRRDDWFIWMDGVGRMFSPCEGGSVSCVRFPGGKAAAKVWPTEGSRFNNSRLDGAGLLLPLGIIK